MLSKYLVITYKVRATGETGRLSFQMKPDDTLDDARKIAQDLIPDPRHEHSHEPLIITSIDVVSR